MGCVERSRLLHELIIAAPQIYVVLHIIVRFKWVLTGDKPPRQTSFCDFDQHVEPTFDIVPTAEVLNLIAKQSHLKAYFVPKYSKNRAYMHMHTILL